MLNISNCKTMNIEKKSSMFCFLPLQYKNMSVLYIQNLNTQAFYSLQTHSHNYGLISSDTTLAKKNSTFIKPSQKCKGIKGNMYAQIDCEFHFEASMFCCCFGGFFLVFFGFWFFFLRLNILHYITICHCNIALN